MRVLAIALATALLAGCSSGSEAGGVPWAEYAPQVRDRVDTAIESGDCQAMDDEFWSASDGSAAHRAKYDEGNGDLMDYITDAMDVAGCS